MCMQFIKFQITFYVIEHDFQGAIGYVVLPKNKELNSANYRKLDISDVDKISGVALFQSDIIWVTNNYLLDEGWNTTSY